MIKSSTKHLQGSCLLEGDILNGDLSDVREGFICECRGVAPGAAQVREREHAGHSAGTTERPERQECVAGNRSGGR